MRSRLISLLPLQIARLLLLVRSIEAVQLENESPAQWVLLIRGRGFTRLLRDDPLVGPTLMRPSSRNLPKPVRLPSRASAKAYAQSVGLMPSRTFWLTKEAGMKGNH